MSVDQTISELSGTLAQLSSLVEHINGQINGITSRINLTLDNFDQAVANIAKDAGSVTYQVGDSVSQVPNSMVSFNMLLFITLIVVFILLSVVLILNLITKVHAIVRIAPSGHLYQRGDDSHFDKSAIAPYSSFSQNSQYMAPANGFRNHISIPMEHEPRRVGLQPLRQDSIDVEPRLYQRRGDEPVKYSSETNSPYKRSLEV
ncbi:hypothetical protein OSTOST_15271, partial [Ostertagia ostertagi]